MGRLWRVHHPGPLPPAGGSLSLEPEEARHVRRVLRLQPGERLGVFDGRGQESLATLVSCAGDEVVVRVDAALTQSVEAALEVVLLQGLCKPELMDWVVQKATEIGVVRIVALLTRRAQRYDPGRARLSRWRRIALESCKQSGRRKLPAVEAADRLPDLPPGTPGLVLDPSADTPPLASRCLALASPRAVWLLVGPEGGLSPEELAEACAGGFQPASLGPRTLRADTAGVVAASILLHRWADLGAAAAPD
jgi:16S rRNA (uracil1498-N3)-methyltransferase